MNILEPKYKPRAVIGLGAVIVFTAILVVHLSLNLKSSSEEAAVLSAVSARSTAGASLDNEECIGEKGKPGYWCEGPSAYNLAVPKTIYNYDAALQAVRSSGAPQYTARKNSDNTTTFYLNGQYAQGSASAGPCTMFNPYPNDTAHGTYIQSDSPACAVPGQDFTTNNVTNPKVK